MKTIAAILTLLSSSFAVAGLKELPLQTNNHLVVGQMTRGVVTELNPPYTIVGERTFVCSEVQGKLAISMCDLTTGDCASITRSENADPNDSRWMSVMMLTAQSSQPISISFSCTGASAGN